MGWFFGFKLHLMVNDEGELLAFRVTTGAVNDQGPVERMARGLWGQLFGGLCRKSPKTGKLRLASH